MTVAVAREDDDKREWVSLGKGDGISFGVKLKLWQFAYGSGEIYRDCWGREVSWVDCLGGGRGIKLPG